MDVITLDQKCVWLHGIALTLLMYSLVGCALPPNPPPKDTAPSAEHSAIQAPIRVIIYFKRPTADNKPLSAAISEVCHCQPVFFRQYREDALIYIIGLPQDHSYPVFENMLLQSAAKLGIKAIEQDVAEHF